MRWLGIRVRSRTARTSCCCETAATTPLVLANTEVGSMSGVITIDTGARSAVTAATGRTAGPAGRTESAVQHDTKSAATAARCIGGELASVCAGAATSGMDGTPLEARVSIEGHSFYMPLRKDGKLKSRSCPRSSCCPWKQAG